MAGVVSFPSKTTRRPPDAVRLGYDFNRWCVEFYRGERFVRRDSYETRSDAAAEVGRLAASGLRRFPDATPTDAGAGAYEPA